MAETSYTIKRFQGGFSEFDDLGTDGSFQEGFALDIRKKVNSLSCNQALVQEGSGVITDLILFYVPASDGNTYLFGNTGKIYKRVPAGTVTLVYTDADGKIIGAAEWGHSNGKSYLYWATSTSLNRKELPGSSDWSDVNATGSAPTWSKKTNLTATTWHTMTAAGGALMICNGDKLAMVGYDQSYTNEALLLTPGSESKSLTEREETVITGTFPKNLSAKAQLFSWAQGALSYLARKKIPTPSINAIIDAEVMLMQGGSNGNLYFSDMVNMMPVHQLPYGGSSNPGAVAEYEGMALFGISGSTDTSKNGVYSYGRKKKNGSFALNFEYPITCDEVGAICVVGSDILMSYKSGSTYKSMRVDSTTKQTAEYVSLALAAPNTDILGVAVCSRIEISGKTMPTGTAIEVYYRVDKDTAWTQAKLNGDVAQMTTGKKGVFFIGAPVDSVIEAKAKLIPAANLTPEIKQIKIVFA